MLLGSVLFLSLCMITVKSQQLTSSTTSMPSTMTRLPTTTTAVPTTRMMDVLHLEAIPDYPVAAGQTVQLSCKNISSKIITWSRFHLQNQSWENVGSGMVLTLTEPKQSGKYRCETHNVFNVKSMSQNHTVYIVSIPTIGENLGKAAFALSVLIWIVIIAGVVWLCWQRFSNKLSALNAPKKDLPAPPEGIPKILPPNNDSDADVYMNYTSTKEDYSNLDPSNMTGDEFYSTLS
ncbi:PREDICTED: uncharacterized protein LOC107087563 [Cyprinodon variegatus]|uniref:uncharacterized protein LOC107087563 n=1 Tax=Cyprinodon variegatus TaxID=28743 RepID=UPI0007428640|nr:PREDICTED: uncharacterized protein LOC107087563 [Cyprinodon variegatus]